MKAILLAAGKGKRLRPLTNEIPKCLLTIGGKPLIEYWFDMFQKYKISDVLINGHYKADLLESFIDDVKNRYDFNILYVYEKELIGTGGTIKNNWEFIKEEKYFLVCHGDNFTNINLSDFLNFHIEKKSELSIALFHTDIPEQCGIVEKMDSCKKIIKFTEKPKNPKSDIASAAIFIMSPKIINLFPNKKVIDFSKEIMPLYQGNMYGYMIDGFNIDIGTIDNYEYANKIVLACEGDKPKQGL